MAEVDANYPVTVGIESSIAEALDAIAAQAEPKHSMPAVSTRARTSSTRRSTGAGVTRPSR